MRKAPTPWRRLEKSMEYFIPQHKIFTGYLGNSGCKPSIPHLNCHLSTKLLNEKSNAPKQSCPICQYFPYRNLPWQITEVSQQQNGSHSVYGKKSTKTKKALEIHILLKKKSAKWSKYNNPLISNYLLLQPEVSECSNTCISHKNLKSSLQKGHSKQSRFGRKPFKNKKEKPKKDPTMLKHWKSFQTNSSLKKIICNFSHKEGSSRGRFSLCL